MKKLLYVFTMVIPSFAFAQKELVITESEAPMSVGVKSAYTVVIPQAKLKDVTESFKKYIKTGSKAKVIDSKTEISIIGAVNSNISALPINVFGKLTETIDGISTTIWVSEGDIFISSVNAPTKSEAVKNYLKNFALAEYKNAVQQELKAEQDKAKDAQKLLDGYIKDQKKAESNITDHKAEIASREKKIKEEEANIANAIANQAKQKVLTDGQSTVVARIQEKLNNIK